MFHVKHSRLSSKNATERRAHRVRIVAWFVLSGREVTRSHISMRSNQSAPTKSDQNTSTRIAQNAPAKSGQNTSAGVFGTFGKEWSMCTGKVRSEHTLTGDWVRRQIVLRALWRGSVRALQGSLFAPRIQKRGFFLFFRCFTWNARDSMWCATMCCQKNRFLPSEGLFHAKCS